MYHCLGRPQTAFLVGDFNIHVDDPHNKESKVFLNMLDAAGLHQFVSSSTHHAGHILDLVITQKANNLVSCVDLKSGLPSDHKAVLISLNFKRPKATKQLIKCRKISEIN